MGRLVRGVHATIPDADAVRKGDATLFTASVKSEWLLANDLTASLFFLSDNIRQLVDIAAKTIATRIHLNRTLTFFVKSTDRDDVLTREYVEIIDENRKYVYPGKLVGTDYGQEAALNPDSENLARLADEFIEAFNNSASDNKEAILRTVLLRTKQGCLQNTASDSSCDETTLKPVLPSSAPSKWLDRDDRVQTPTDFIKSTYAEWLGKGLTQAHIRRLDKSLYMALHKWLQSNEMPPDLDLPTRKQLNDRQLEAAGLPSDPRNLGEQDRESLRLHLVAHARAHRASL